MATATLTDDSPAPIDELKRIADQLPDHWALCNFLDNCEAETIIFQAVKSSVYNFDKIGLAATYQGSGLKLTAGGGLIDNPRGLKITLDRGLLIEGEHDDKKTLVPTVRLIKQLDGHLSKA